MNLNCSELMATKYIPSTTEAIGVSGKLGVGVVVLGAMVVTTMYGIFLEESFFLYRHWPFKFYLLSISCLSGFPVVGLCLFITLLVPRAAHVLNTFIVLYLPFPMLAFFMLIACYIGCVVDKLEGHQVPLQGPPLCCICFCCPKPPFNKKRFCFMKTAVCQLFFMPLVLFGIGELCSLAGIDKSLEFSLSSLSPYLLCLNALSFFLGVYGLVIFTRMASAVLDGFYIRGKFIVLQLQFILVRFQFLLFDMLAKLEIMPCYAPFSAAVSAIYLRSALLLGEGFVLAVVGRLFFLHPPPYSFQHHIPCES